MDEWIELTEYNWAFWVAGMFALFEFFRWAYGGLEWLCKTFGLETKKMRQAREWQERLKKAEADIAEIKITSQRNVEMFLEHEKQVVEQLVGIRNEIVSDLGKLQTKIEETNRANDQTDCAMLRDRIKQGMRYFEQPQNIGADGKVHISLSDWENMNGLFQEYFTKHGNGAFKKMYDDEFIHFVIDR